MVLDYSEYLAATVLSERQYVSYRQLSRALNIHSNLAKQMLYEFHRIQTAKKPESVHATYLITGTKRLTTNPPSSSQPKTNGHSQGDAENTPMQSSPPFPSSSFARSEGSVNNDGDDHESALIRSIVLVKEENLYQAREDFLSVSSIHIYSIEPNTVNDLQILTECNRKVSTQYASEDPLKAWKQYGTIQNPEVRRRERKGSAAPPVSARAPEVIAPATKMAPKKQDEGTLKTEESKADTTVKAVPEAKPASKPPPPATTKRQGSDIFKSFAKTQSKPKAAEPTPKQEQTDEPMLGFSDDDEGDDNTAGVMEEEVKVPEGKSKKEREAELQAMMEQEDEEMEDAEAPAAEPEEPEVTIDAAAAQKMEDPKETVSVENGRRRGRRRVMKRKTVKDEEGFLVTKEEPAWESFSEDEPAPKMIKIPPTSTMNSGKVVKKGGKPGQGNIMSFFSKK